MYKGGLRLTAEEDRMSIEKTRKHSHNNYVNAFVFLTNNLRNASPDKINQLNQVFKGD